MNPQTEAAFWDELEKIAYSKEDLLKTFRQWRGSTDEIGKDGIRRRMLAKSRIGANTLSSHGFWPGMAVVLIPSTKLSPVVGIGPTGLVAGVSIKSKDQPQESSKEDSKKEDWLMGHDKLNPPKDDHK